MHQECVTPASLRESQRSQVDGASIQTHPALQLNPQGLLPSASVSNPMNSEIVQPPNLEFPDSPVPSPSIPGAASLGNGSLSTGEQPESEIAPIPAGRPGSESVPADSFQS